MKRKKLTIDLGNNPLSDTQLKKILSDVHTAVKGNMAVMQPPKTKSKPPVLSLTEAAATVGVTATISATFTNVNPGLSELNATLKGVTKKLTQSGTLSFDNVSPGQVIRIQGKSLGTADISVDITAKPQQMKFAPGTFNFFFFIK